MADLTSDPSLISTLGTMVDFSYSQTSARHVGVKPRTVIKLGCFVRAQRDLFRCITRVENLLRRFSQGSRTQVPTAIRDWIEIGSRSYTKTTPDEM